MVVILDDHEFGSYFGGVMTSSDVPATVRMWNKVFGKYKGNPNVLPAFMNEPYKLYSSVWSIEQAWIDGMRNDGWTQTLVVSGRNFSPLTGYGKTFGAAALTLTDPLNDLLFDGHIYFDSDSSGTHSDVMGLTDADLADPVAFEGKVRTWLNNNVDPSMTWARNNGKKFLVGEIALPNTNVGNAARPIVVKYFDENSDVIQHMTWFVLSSWMNYPGYIFGLGQSGAPSPIFLETTKARQAVVP
jgi:endoglucanase